MPDPAVRPDAPGDVRDRIRSFVHTRFPLGAKLEDDVSLLDAGVIDSLGILDVVGFLEQDFGIQVQDEELNPVHFDSVDALARFVESKRG